MKIQSFRFTTNGGQRLIDKIALIEQMATEKLQAGTNPDSVRKGAMALLQIACNAVQADFHSRADDDEL